MSAVAAGGDDAADAATGQMPADRGDAAAPSTATPSTGPGASGAATGAGDGGLASNGADASNGAAQGTPPGIACTRTGLRLLVEQYFEALAAHDPTRLSLAPHVKFTENARSLALGTGLWSAAGNSSALRSAFDPDTCQTFSVAVVERPNAAADQPDGPAIVGVRLKLDQDALSEIESYVVLSTGVFFSAAGFADAATHGWETPLASDQRLGRDELIATANAYLAALGNAPSTVRYDAACERWDNGQPADSCANSSTARLNPLPVTHARVPVVDVGAGVVVATGLFDVSIPGFAMLKVAEGRIRLADVGTAFVSQGATTSGWE